MGTRKLAVSANPIGGDSSSKLAPFCGSHAKTPQGQALILSSGLEMYQSHRKQTSVRGNHDRRSCAPSDYYWRVPGEELATDQQYSLPN
jgi:hypothetical protein